MMIFKTSQEILVLLPTALRLIKPAGSSLADRLADVPDPHHP